MEPSTAQAHRGEGPSPQESCLCHLHAATTSAGLVHVTLNVTERALEPITACADLELWKMRLS